MDGTVGTERVTSQRGAVADAAAILGVSVVTVRRMIKRGQLEAERVLRPQGSADLVTLPAALGDGTGDRPPTELLAAWSTAVLAPLVAELAESRETIRDQAETIGRQSAALERDRATIVSLGDELAAERAKASLDARRAPHPSDPTPESFTGRLRGWITPALAVIAIVTVIALLVWPW
jgi:Helix-turn-helix domain